MQRLVCRHYMNKELAIRVSFFLLRIVSGWLLFQAGTLKLFGWWGGMPPGQGPLSTQITIGAWMELIGGLLVIFGLLTRPAAFLLSGMMAVAYWQFHFKPELFWPTQNQGVPAVTLCFIFLFVAAYGGGRWSLDAMIAGQRYAEDAP
jgi:putative oxidoreductase